MSGIHFFFFSFAPRPPLLSSLPHCYIPKVSYGATVSQRSKPHPSNPITARSILGRAGHNDGVGGMTAVVFLYFCVHGERHQTHMMRIMRHYILLVGDNSFLFLSVGRGICQKKLSRTHTEHRTATGRSPNAWAVCLLRL